MNIKPKSSIEIYTDKEQYVPGDNVTGKVLLRIKKELKVKDLYLALTGEIYCKTHIHGLDKGKWTDYNIQEEKKNLLNLKSHLYKFEGGKIKKGEFNVKFGFQLPPKMEYASMHCKGSYGISRDESQHYQQYVKYSLMAWFPAKGKKREIEYLGRQTIHIKQLHKFNLPPKVYNRKNFSFCYCFNTGHIELGLKLQRLEYQASDQMHFDFEYENYPPQERKPISLRWQVIRKLVFKGQEYIKPYIQGELEHFQQKSHSSSITLPLAMTMTHKSQFVEVQNMLQIEYCLPNDEVFSVQQEFAVTHSNAPIKKKSNDDDSASVGSRLSDADREDIIISEVNWNKCNSRLEEIHIGNDDNEE